jgi:RND family efflux transporter MFP subunit
MVEQPTVAPPSPRKRRFTFRVFHLIVLIVVIATIVAVVMAKKAAARRQASSGVRTVQVTRGTIVQTISATGVVDAETGAHVKIGSQISGRIKRLTADIGTQVYPGQVIAELDAPDLRANLDSARRNAAQAQEKHRQQLEGVGMIHTQLAGAYQQASEAVNRAYSEAARARAALGSARSRLKSALSAEVSAAARLRDSEARLRSAQANVEFQTSQTSTDIQKAKAALSTAQSSLVQVQKSTDLEVANAETALKQAQANATLAAANLKREEALLAKGFSAQADVDAARTNAEVTAQQVETAGANLNLTQAKVAADLPAARDQVDQARAALVAAQAETHTETMRNEDVRSAEANRDDARAAVDQAHQGTAAAQSDVAAAVGAVRSADIDVRSARAAQQTALANMTQDRLKQRDIAAAFEALRQAQAQVRFQEAQFAKSFIHTPIGGTVVTLAQQQGETVAAGLSAPTLIEVVDLNRLEVDAYVDETDIGQVRLGQGSTVTVDAYPDRKFPGKVVKVASAATMQQNVVTYLVTVHLDAACLRGFILKPQMTTDVQIHIQRKENILLAPNEAVKQRRGVSQVAVLKQGKAEVREVKTGLTDGENSEILSGLNEGDTLVVAGFDKLGVKGFSSAAEVPGFLTRTPFGTTAPKSSAQGGAQGGGQAGGRGAGGGGGR